MIRRYGSLALLALAVIAAPRIGHAQEVATTSATSLDPAALPAAPVVADAPATQLSVGPTLDGATVGFQRASAQTAQVPVALAPPRGGHSTALMLVGGAALLAGAVIGGDAGTIIMVSGAVIGLYGLYLYLQ